MILIAMNIESLIIFLRAQSHDKFYAISDNVIFKNIKVTMTVLHRK